jgi:pyruvate formate lyase activating enzyme
VTNIGAFLARHLAGIVDRWELCTFNNLCRDKYRRLGLEWKLAQEPLISQETLHELEECAKASGVNPDVVIATGMTQ